MVHCRYFGVLLLILPWDRAFVESFVPLSPLSNPRARPYRLLAQEYRPTRSIQLFAKKKSAAKKKKKGTKGSSSGFGGAAVEPCPCGSTLAYSKCCYRLHKSRDAFASASAEQVVRARYSAYAKREVSDFVACSTT